MFAGLLMLLAAAFGVASHVWLSRSVLVPMAGEGVDYLFVSATSRSLLAIAAAAAVLLLLAHLLVRRDAARHGVQPPLLSWADTAYMAPLCWFAVTPLALLNLIPSVSPFFSVA